MFSYYIDHGMHFLLLADSPVFGSGYSLRDALESLVKELRWLEDDVAKPENEGTEHPYYAQVCRWLQIAEANLEGFERSAK